MVWAIVQLVIIIKLDVMAPLSADFEGDIGHGIVKEEVIKMLPNELKSDPKVTQSNHTSSQKSEIYQKSCQKLQRPNNLTLFTVIIYECF